ncbi:MAG: hypothetical protein JXM73_15360 [Anaerolineae bacterium]|nr:hypothetical protein [Anaerolineae bacterium]
MEMAVPNVSGSDTPFRLIGLQEADVATALAHCGATLVEGLSWPRIPICQVARGNDGLSRGRQR